MSERLPAPSMIVVFSFSITTWRKSTGLKPNSDSVRDMRYPMPLLLMCWMATACAQQPATLWTFDGLDRIGKYAMTASGSPSIVKEKDGRSIFFRGEPDAALPNVNPIADWSSFTIEAWIKPRSTGARLEVQAVNLYFCSRSIYGFTLSLRA